MTARILSAAHDLVTESQYRRPDPSWFPPLSADSRRGQSNRNIAGLTPSFLTLLDLIAGTESLFTECYMGHLVFSDQGNQ
jgi:hypothetical protein